MSWHGNHNTSRRVTLDCERVACKERGRNQSTHAVLLDGVASVLILVCLMLMPRSEATRKKEVIRVAPVVHD
jgi:hypothetical protein